MFQPQTQIRFLSNAEVDVGRNNVRGFSTIDAQTNYFLGKTKYAFDTCSVQDVRGFSGYIMAPIGLAAPNYPGLSIDGYYDCNYVMYKNSGISGKWFYAYIGTPEIVNSGCVRIPYVIDQWQTWIFDFGLGECLVARETVSDDTIGRWLLPENIETGEFVMVDSGSSGPGTANGIDLLSSWDDTPCAMIAYTYSPAGESDEDTYTVEEVANGLTYKFKGLKVTFAGGFLVDGIYQANMFMYVSFKDSDDLKQKLFLINSYIKSLVGEGQVNKIQAIKMVPKYMMSSPEYPYGGWDDWPKDLTVGSLQCVGGASPTSFGGYVPENNKLFTQQYNYFVVDNGIGTQEEFGYEYFKGYDTSPNVPVRTPSFKVYRQVSLEPSLKLVPVSYKCTKNKENDLYAMEISGFPTCSFSYSNFQNEFGASRAQQAVQGARDTYNAIKGVVGGAASIVGGVSTGVAAGNPLAAVGGVANGIDTIANTALDVAGQVAEYQDKSRIPNVVAGQASGNIQFARHKMKFTQYRMQVQPEYARKIDKYFSAYGYRVDEFKVPSVSGRKCWNYVQCVAPVVKGNIPIEAAEEIRAMLTAGLRVWHEGATWMDFSQRNPIV